MSSYLTRDDEYNYGKELLDVAQRAAMHTVAPHLQALQQQNAVLERKLSKEQRHRLDEQVEKLVPDFREIDRNPRWHKWLLGIDSLTGRPRQMLLNEAVAQHNAPRVREFFERFRRADSRPSPTHSAPLHHGGLPGRPTYTRRQVAQLYDGHRRGAYAGREAEWNRIEADIIAASREGRILGGVDVHGK
jgi:hypothetical protein